MTKIGRLWAGKLYGTNTGNLAAELESTDSTVKGKIRFMDDRWGLVVYDVVGSFDGSKFEVKGKPTQAPDNVATGEAILKGALSPDGSLRGEWATTLGTGGTFLLLPHDVATPAVPGALPEQLHTAVRPFGAIRLYADDIRQLIDLMKRDFNQSRVVVTFRERGSEISKYSNEFENDVARLGTIRYLKLYIQEPEAYGINRVVSVLLDATGQNEIRVQGVQESWVVGKAAALASFIDEREKFLSSTFKKYGLNVNGILLIGALILLPELSIPKRIVFMCVVFLLAWMIKFIHSSFIPNALIRLSAAKPTFLERFGPPIGSWVSTIAAAVIGFIINSMLKGEMSIPTWLHFWS